MDEFEHIRAEEQRARTQALAVIWTTHVIVIIAGSIAASVILRFTIPIEWVKVILSVLLNAAWGWYGTRWTINFLKRKDMF